MPVQAAGTRARGAGKLARPLGKHFSARHTRSHRRCRRLVYPLKNNYHAPEGS